MIPLECKTIFFNGHSIKFQMERKKFLSIWLCVLKKTLEYSGQKFTNVVFTFDDFYKADKNILCYLHGEGVKNIIIFYSPSILINSKNCKYLMNHDVGPDSMGGLSEILDIKENLKNVHIGLHGWAHENYLRIGSEQATNLITKQINYHKKLFNEKPKHFAFPFGKASNEAIDVAMKNFEYVYLSDNTRKITRYIKDSNSNLINRRHLELGEQLFKVLSIIILQQIR